eukprot:TRINITY_DN3646_c0_g3_i3.p3 TRINITY_DN3646_c0_g3~~TRINITY_DN3646_c0_g3_i3.p3  ORF type:complete len:105 (-),score=6.09 TRINITY_DN3646_c0_g3_i3:204-518(-)
MNESQYLVQKSTKSTDQIYWNELGGRIKYFLRFFFFFFFQIGRGLLLFLDSVNGLRPFCLWCPFFQFYSNKYRFRKLKNNNNYNIKNKSICMLLALVSCRLGSV